MTRRRRRNRKRKAGPARPSEGGGETPEPRGERSEPGPDAPRAEPAPPAPVTAPRNRLIARSLAIVLAAHAGLLCLALIVASPFRPEPRVIGFDVLSKPGATLALRAGVFREGPDLPLARFEPGGHAVEFRALGRRDVLPALDGDGALDLDAGEVLGSAVTDADGIATLAVTAPGDPGHYLYGMRVTSKAGSEVEDAYLVVTVANDDAGILISDIDNTLGVSRSKPEDVAPLDDAQRVLSEQSRTRTIVYITDRPPFLSRRTRSWLAEHGFPIGPIFFRTLPPESATFFDASHHRDVVIRDIRSRFKNVPWGIVSGEGDAHVCVNNDIDAIVVSPLAGAGVEEITARIRRASTWAAIETLLEKS